MARRKKSAEGAGWLRRRIPSHRSDAVVHARDRRTRAAVAWQFARSMVLSSLPKLARRVDAPFVNDVAQTSMRLLVGSVARQPVIRSVSNTMSASGGWVVFARVGASAMPRKRQSLSRCSLP